MRCSAVASRVMFKKKKKEKEKKKNTETEKEERKKEKTSPRTRCRAMRCSAATRCAAFKCSLPAVCSWFLHGSFIFLKTNYLILGDNNEHCKQACLFLHSLNSSCVKTGKERYAKTGKEHCVKTGKERCAKTGKERCKNALHDSWSGALKRKGALKRCVSIDFLNKEHR
jgi:hypothetical protein